MAKKREPLIPAHIIEKVITEHLQGLLLHSSRHSLMNMVEPYLRLHTHDLKKKPSRGVKLAAFDKVFIELLSTESKVEVTVDKVLPINREHGAPIRPQQCTFKLNGFEANFEIRARPNTDCEMLGLLESDDSNNVDYAVDAFIAQYMASRTFTKLGGSHDG